MTAQSQRTRVLVAVPHYYGPSSSQVLGSSVDTAEERASVVASCLRQAASLLTDHTFTAGTSANIANDVIAPAPKRISGDMVVCVSGENHLLALATHGFVAKPRPYAGDPKMLGFACREAFAEQVENYDLFCFIEDDTAIYDGAFFEKADAFYRAFGDERVLLPSRYEVFGARDAAWRVYLERDHPPRYLVEPKVDGPEELRLPGYDGDVVFERTTSLGAGCYIITREQLRWWMQQPGFLQAIGGRLTLEAAMIPLEGHFPFYRPAAQNLSFLEVHHTPNRCSQAATPRARIGALARAEINRRRGG